MRSSAALLFICLAISVAGLAQARQDSAEQSVFSAEDEGVQRPAVLPPGVLVILGSDPAVRNAMKYHHPPLKKLSLSWFSASVVHLAGAREEDILVMGEGTLRGANMIAFWVFRPTVRGYELILNGPAHDLTVGKTRWKGFREIVLRSATANKVHVATLRFDGRRYVLSNEKWADTE